MAIACPGAHGPQRAHQGGHVRGGAPSRGVPGAAPPRARALHHAPGRRPDPVRCARGSCALLHGDGGGAGWRVRTQHEPLSGRSCRKGVSGQMGMQDCALGPLLFWSTEKASAAQASVHAPPHVSAFAGVNVPAPGCRHKAAQHRPEREPKREAVEVQPECIGGIMREYQVEGLRWIVSRLGDAGVNAILADEMVCPLLPCKTPWGFAFAFMVGRAAPWRRRRQRYHFAGIVRFCIHMGKVGHPTRHSPHCRCNGAQHGVGRCRQCTPSNASMASNTWQASSL